MSSGATPATRRADERLVNPWHASLHAWQIDIDGNVVMGTAVETSFRSCILRVQSPRRQWYHHRLQPWEHLVPNADLSNLGEQLTWCIDNRQECAAIATAGRALAEQVVQEIEDDLLNAGALRAIMDVSSIWTARDWMNRGSELLDSDPWLAKRLLAYGLKIEPSEAIAWFNLGIGLHQQRRISAAVRAYQHCLALPHSQETEQAARNNLAQDLLLLGRWQEGWSHYAQRFVRNRKPSLPKRLRASNLAS